ncbi:MAG: isoprenylcysteine carboxyl methyltransferase family protein [Alphaproteobacteria bacterium]
MSLAAWLILLAVAVERCCELGWSYRNERRLRARGGREYGRGHYVLFPLLHAAWLLALAVHVALQARIEIVWPLIGVYGLLQVVRGWVLWSLGARWTTRIIVLPGVPLVRTGLYRFMRHPNYLVVALELAILPVALEAWPIAVVATILNLALLAYRIRVEERALATAGQGSM